MAGARYVYRKARTKKEQQSGTLVGLMDAINQVIYGSWFIFLGITGVLRDMFFAFETFFFLGTFVLNAAAVIFYLYSFIHAANRNIFKLSNIAIRVFSISLTLLLMFGGALVAPTVIMAARIISLLVNPIQFLTRFIYFLYKYLSEDRPSFKAFFLSKVSENGLGALISCFIIFGIVLLYTVASLPVGLMLALSVLGPVVVLAVQTFKLFSFLQGDPEKMAVNTDKANQDPASNLSHLGNTTARLSVEMRDTPQHGGSQFHLSMLPKGIQAHIPANRSIGHKLDLHRHSLPKARDISESRIEVRQLKQKIMHQMQGPSAKTSWLLGILQTVSNKLQLKKRQDKINALEFLEVIQHNFLHIPRSAILNPIRIDETFFKYTSIDDLFNQVQQHVLETWPNAFQSDFTNISHTESCFQTVCMLLNEKFLPTPKSLASPSVPRRA